ncbi:hypothetical protein [Ramlibacter sp.]|uniref:hypothetical protein n=1 Tax=Ramlibacter sp. TaxID=1917967 RepID=UPI002B9CD234|nr:hypothetical protein [Ramlibacter sp.]HWI82315.1 hypothetical protein [Ramlibacter sp.]
MPSKRPEPPPDLEISWRTEELGPETRRRLFEKLVPSGRPGAQRDGPPLAKEPKQGGRGDGPKRRK